MTSIAQSVVAQQTHGARMWAYVWWQFRDFAMSRGVVILVLGLLSGWPLVQGIRLMVEAGTHQTNSVLLLVPWINTMIYFFVFLSVNGMVSRDRTSGLYRFLFAKPVSVPRFYGQLAAVHLVGLLATVGILYVVALAVGAPVPPDLLFIPFVVVGVGLGGLYFLASVITRYDIAVTGFVGIISYLLYVMYGDKGGIIGALIHVLPPAHLFTAFGGGAPGLPYGYAMHDALWVCGYGLACFLLGLGLLTRRPLGVS